MQVQVDSRPYQLISSLRSGRGQFATLETFFGLQSASGHHQFGLEVWCRRDTASVEHTTLMTLTKQMQDSVTGAQIDLPL